MRAPLAYLHTLRRWAWMIALFTFVSVVATAAISLELPKEYESTAVVLVNPKQVLLPGADTGYSTQLDQLVQTYVQLIGNKPVWDQLIADGIPRTSQELGQELTVKREPNTSLIDVTVRDHDPRVALLIAQKVIPAFNKSLGDLQAKVTKNQAQLDGLVPWSVPSEAPVKPVSPRVVLNIGIAVVAGLLISTAIAFGLEFFDDTVKNEYDVRLRLGLPLLVSIFFRRGAGRQQSRSTLALITMTQPNEPIAEAFKALRTGLLFSAVGDKPLSRIVVTSTVPGEGKTSTACNLAIAMAQAGKRVILVDADFRRPNLHEIFGRGSNVGLGNMILDDHPLEDLILATDIPALSVVCSGPAPPNPSELLGSARMTRVLSRLHELCDVLILDTPPVGPVTDATVLAARADGVILVVDGGRTPVAAVLRTRDTLMSVNARIIGVVLNKLRSAQGQDYYQYYRGGEKGGATPGAREPLEAPVGPTPIRSTGTAADR